jgi:hypothetical protein
MCLGDFVACGKAGLEIVLASPWMCRAEHRWQTSEHDGSVPDAKLGSRPKEWAYGRGSRMQIAATAAHFCNGSSSDLGLFNRDFRFCPVNGHRRSVGPLPLWANRGSTHRSKQPHLNMRRVNPAPILKRPLRKCNKSVEPPGDGRKILAAPRPLRPTSRNSLNCINRKTKKSWVRTENMRFRV